MQNPLRASNSEGPKDASKESWQDLLTRITGIQASLRVRPYCGKGKMIQRETVYPIPIGAGAEASTTPTAPLCPP